MNKINKFAIVPVGVVIDKTEKKITSLAIIEEKKITWDHVKIKFKIWWDILPTYLYYHVWIYFWEQNWELIRYDIYGIFEKHVIEEWKISREFHAEYIEETFILLGEGLISYEPEDFWISWNECYSQVVDKLIYLIRFFKIWTLPIISLPLYVVFFIIFVFPVLLYYILKSLLKLLKFKFIELKFIYFFGMIIYFLNFIFIEKIKINKKFCKILYKLYLNFKFIIIFFYSFKNVKLIIFFKYNLMFFNNIYKKIEFFIKICFINFKLFILFLKKFLY